MFSRILVAVDGSTTSDMALREAIRLAKEQQARLRIVHVVDLVLLSWPELGDINAIQDAFRESGRQILARAEAELRASGATGESKLIEAEKLGERVADQIAAEADSWPADLIVIGTHGRRGLDRLLLGSVAEGVTRVASKPVLLIRGQ